MPPSYSINSHTIEFLIPDRDKHGNPVDPKPVEQRLSVEIAETLGGLRKRIEQSIWLDPQGVLMHENTIVLESSFNISKLPDLMGLMAIFTLLLAITLDQAELAAKIDGKLVIIPADQNPESYDVLSTASQRGPTCHKTTTITEVSQTIND